MMAREITLRLIAVAAVTLIACGPDSGIQDDIDAGLPDGPDAMPGGCDPAADDDGDCIPNGVEGCLQSPPRDTDNDSTPDYLDLDSDNDGIPDNIEVGPSCEHPADHDEDGTPNYIDRDSDNDGVNDGDEDRNGDGVIGTCTHPCTQPSHCAPEAYCSIPLNSTTGTCLDLECTDGETDPLNPDTDGDGVPDGLEGTFICNPASEENPDGLKPIKYVDSIDTAYDQSNWRLALELSALEGVPSINSPTLLNAAYTFDMIEPDAQVAGFLASRNAGTSTATGEIESLLIGLESAPFVDTVSVRASGNNTTTLDGFETVLGASIEVTTTTMLDVTELREIVLPVALGRSPADVEFPPPGWVGTPDNRFVVSVQAIRRADAVQTLFVGGVARVVSAEDITRDTAFHLADMSNGTGISVSGNGEQIECEQFIATHQPKADIIFVVDESGSTSDDRTRIADNASLFFDKAVAAGLDFRVGVTDMEETRDGLFASRQAGGTGDRWLLPTEQAQFEADINDPSGPDAADGANEHGLTQAQAALMRHLPRDNSDPQKIREDAVVVVIFLTDEKPDEIEDAGILGEGNHEPSAAEQTEIDAFMASYISYFIDNEVTAHLIAEPLPFDSTCSGGGAEHAYGYYSLVNATGGQMASICQADLSATIDALIEDIIGSSSPLTLSKFPISASIAVARDGVPLPRSRESGFEYRGSSNAIVFFNQPFDPANPAEVVVSYRRWDEQVPVE